MGDEIQLLAEETDLVRSTRRVGGLDSLTELAYPGAVCPACLRIEQLPRIARRDRMGRLLVTWCTEAFEIQSRVRTPGVRKQVRERAEPLAIAKPAELCVAYVIVQYSPSRSNRASSLAVIGASTKVPSTRRRRIGIVPV